MSIYCEMSCVYSLSSVFLKYLAFFLSEALRDDLTAAKEFFLCSHFVEFQTFNFLSQVFFLLIDTFPENEPRLSSFVSSIIFLFLSNL